MKSTILTILQWLSVMWLTVGIDAYTLYAQTADDAIASSIDTTHISQIPVVTMTYDQTAFNKKTFIPATFTLYEADSIRTYQCKVRHRGATSLAYDKPNYAVKMLDEEGGDRDVRLAGMRKDNYWILDAMASDFGKVRNRVSMDLWLAFSRKPYHHALEPKSINGYRGRYVEVYVNDQYEGLFCLMERVDRKQLHLKKYKKEHEEVAEDSTVTIVPQYHRGLLYKAVNGANTRTPYLLWQPDEPNNTKQNYDGMQGEYPDVTKGEPWDWNCLRDNIYFMAAKTSSTFNLGVGDRFDVPVFVDYVLFIDLLFANDNVGKNVFYWFYDQSSDDQRISVTPWDLDTSWGRNYQGSRVDARKVLSNKSNFNTRFEKWGNGYADTLATRYAQLRDHWWREERLVRRFDQYFDLFDASGAWQRECERWGNSNCKTRGLEEEREYVHQWIHDRFAFLDETYGYAGEPEEDPFPDEPDNPEEPEDSDEPEDPEETDSAIEDIMRDTRHDATQCDLSGRRIDGKAKGLSLLDGAIVFFK